MRNMTKDQSPGIKSDLRGTTGSLTPVTTASEDMAGLVDDLDALELSVQNVFKLLSLDPGHSTDIQIADRIDSLEEVVDSIWSDRSGRTRRTILSLSQTPMKINSGSLPLVKSPRRRIRHSSNHSSQRKFWRDMWLICCLPMIFLPL